MPLKGSNRNCGPMALKGLGGSRCERRSYTVQGKSQGPHRQDGRAATPVHIDPSAESFSHTPPAALSQHWTTSFVPTAPCSPPLPQHNRSHESRQSQTCDCHLSYLSSAAFVHRTRSSSHPALNCPKRNSRSLLFPAGPRLQRGWQGGFSGTHRNHTRHLLTVSAATWRDGSCCGCSVVPL